MKISKNKVSIEKNIQNKEDNMNFGIKDQNKLHSINYRYKERLGYNYN